MRGSCGAIRLSGSPCCKRFAFNRRQLFGSIIPSELASWPVKSRSSCWAVGALRSCGRLLRDRLAATRGAMARLTARRTLGRARVSPLNAFGLQNLLAMAGIIPMVRPNI